MKTKYLIIAFVVTALLQAAVPLKMIYDSEMTEREGIIYRFKTAPIDPTDPFRGKYVALAFACDTIATKDSVWAYNQKAYATIVNDSEGYAKVTAVSREAPESGDYVQILAQHHYQGTLFFNFPFDRFYMEESKAHEAETTYVDYNNSQNIKNRKPAYALVAIKDGNAVLKDVIVDGIPIREFVLKQREEKK